MSEDVLLTSENFVRTNGNISNNINGKYLLPSIREAQEIGLQSVIGTELFEKLKSLVGNGTIKDEVNKAYERLLGIVQFYLLYEVLTRICVISHVKLGNAGLTMAGDENHLDVLDLKDVFSMEDYYQNKSDFYRKRVQEYCLANKHDLPELSKHKCKEIHANLYSANSSGLWLGGARGKKGLYDKGK